MGITALPGMKHEQSAGSLTCLCRPIKASYEPHPCDFNPLSPLVVDLAVTPCTSRSLRPCTSPQMPGSMASSQTMIVFALICCTASGMVAPAPHAAFPVTHHVGCRRRPVLSRLGSTESESESRMQKTARVVYQETEKGTKWILSFPRESWAPDSITSIERQLREVVTTTKAVEAVEAEEDNLEAEEDNLLIWRLMMLGITASWGCNFAVIKLALDTLGDSASAGSLFMAARFTLAALLLSPFLGKASSRSVVNTGVGVGALCAAGYACQAASLAMGTAAGTSAFICSLQAVVVALLVARSVGYVDRRTVGAIVLAVAGVGCLELPSVMADGAPPPSHACHLAPRASPRFSASSRPCFQWPTPPTCPEALPPDALRPDALHPDALRHDALFPSPFPHRRRLLHRRPPRLWPAPRIRCILRPSREGRRRCDAG